MTTLKITGMTCDSCAVHVKEALEKVPGVQSANVSYTKGSAKLAVLHVLTGAPIAACEEMLAKTAADNRKSAEQVAAAEADYNAAMAGARTEASAIRDEARNEGRKVVDQARAAASGEVAETLKGADQALSAQRQSTQTELQSSVDNLSQTLASRILGVELAADVKSGGSQ